MLSGLREKAKEKVAKGLVKTGDFLDKKTFELKGKIEEISEQSDSLILSKITTKVNRGINKGIDKFNEGRKLIEKGKSILREGFKESYLINANDFLEENYPKNGTCRRESEASDINNYGKKRSEITHLNFSEEELIDTLNLTDFINLEWLNCRDNQLTNLILPNNEQLRSLTCGDNRLTNLDVSNYFNLRELICYNNQLIQLTLPTTNQLAEIDVSNNYLTTFNYDCLNPNTLTELRLFNNNLTATKLDAFNQLVNLNNLSIGNDDHWIEVSSGNQFIGSLASLQKLDKLEWLNIDNLNLKTDFQYLSANLQHLICSGQMREELIIYGHNLQFWQAYNSKLMKEAQKGIINLENLELQFKRQIITPFEMISRSARTTNYQQQFQYDSFLIRDFHSFSFKKNNFSQSDNSLENNSLKSSIRQLPLRLYQVSTNQVLDSELIFQNSNYAILSYVWGNLSDKSNLTTKDYTYRKKDETVENKQIGVNLKYNATGTTRESIQALQKAIATLNFINKDLAFANKIDYLWMDQICINQFDNIEQGQEVPKMKQYYSNSAVTLVVVDEELGELKNVLDEYELTREIIMKIINSPWFTRAWTFQEGLLSKQTIFMFDDCLVDGRSLALYWGGILGSYNRPSTFITPLGWSYHNQTSHLHDCEQTKQVTNLTLGEALEATSHREKTVLLDSIYSILGLLPYGEKVAVHYKSFGETYAQPELKAKLLELIEQAYLYDQKEVISYLGERNPANWWLPIVKENNSFNVIDSLNSDGGGGQHYLSQIHQVTKQGIQLQGHYTVINDAKIIELDCADDINKVNWDSTLQFTLNKSQQLISIEQVYEWHHPDSQFGYPEEFFIDMVNFEVIAKSEQPERYRELCYQLLINYAKSKPELSQAEIKYFSSLTSLDLSELNWTEALDLSALINFEVFWCYINRVAELTLPLDNKLKVIEIDDCYLTSFNYACLNPTALTWLNVSNNDLELTNINVFSHLVNLEKLWIGSWSEDDEEPEYYSEKIKNNIYNRFDGSLEAWKDLTKLKSIYISNTDINDGVEFLSHSIIEIKYSTKERPACKLNEIAGKITEWWERKQVSNEITQLEEIIEDLNIATV